MTGHHSVPNIGCPPIIRDLSIGAGLRVVVSHFLATLFRFRTVTEASRCPESSLRLHD
jgi:hypothetical protein